jgi:hypothetical protein
VCAAAQTGALHCWQSRRKDCGEGHESNESIETQRRRCGDVDLSKSQMQATVFFDQALAIVMCEALVLPLSAAQQGFGQTCRGWVRETLFKHADDSEFITMED